MPGFLQDQCVTLLTVEPDVLGEACGADITERLLLPTVLAMATDSVANVRYLSIYQSILSIYLSIYVSIVYTTVLSIYLSIYQVQRGEDPAPHYLRTAQLHHPGPGQALSREAEQRLGLRRQILRLRGSNGLLGGGPTAPPRAAMGKRRPEGETAGVG